MVKERKTDWNNPNEVRAYQREDHQTEAFKKWNREYQKKRYRTPKGKKWVKEYYQRPEVKQRNKERQRKYRKRPEIREYCRVYNKKYRQKPRVKEKERERWRKHKLEEFAKIDAEMREFLAKPLRKTRKKKTWEELRERLKEKYGRGTLYFNFQKDPTKRVEQEKKKLSE